MSQVATRPQGQPRNGVRALITQPAYQARFAEMLKERAPQFITSVTSQCGSGPLAQVNPESVIAAAFTAATLDLPVDRNLGFAWIVPYKGMAQFQMGYKGYIQLAFRTSQYRRMNATPINAEALAGFDFVGEPIIDFTKLDDEKPAVGYALVFELVNGFRKTIYWSRQKVEKHAKRYSQSYGRGSNSPWSTHFDEMALKTVIANGLKKWGILSVEMQKAFHHDQGAQIDIDSEVVFPDGNELVQNEVKPGLIGSGNPVDDQQQPAEEEQKNEQEKPKSQPRQQKPKAEPDPEPEQKEQQPEHAYTPRKNPQPVEEEQGEPSAEDIQQAQPAPEQKKAAAAQGPTLQQLQTEVTNKLTLLNVGKRRFCEALAEQDYTEAVLAFGSIPTETLQSVVDAWDDFKEKLLPQ